MAMQLTNHPSYNFILKAITTCSGNCHVNQVIKNVAKIRKANDYSTQTGPDITLGCDVPILTQTTGDKSKILEATYFHGLDGLGNNTFEDAESGISASSLSSTDRIIQICSQVMQHNQNTSNTNKIELTLVMLGPLTNLASALHKRPNTDMPAPVLDAVSHLVVMGGCGNGHGNVTRVAEFNVAADPGMCMCICRIYYPIIYTLIICFYALLYTVEAAEIVFKVLEANSSTYTSIVSWELTLKHTIPWYYMLNSIYA